MVALATLGLTGCIAQVETLTGNDLVDRAAFSAVECGGPGEERCNFFNGPVQLTQNPVKLASREQSFFPTANRLEFVDSVAFRWVAPRNTLTDGASIPSIFVPVIGERQSPEFVNAAAVHDAQCGVGNEALPEFHSKTWQETHRMFYDALRVGGTEEVKAKIMYAAVYLGGPRWEDAARDLTIVPRADMERTMREARQYILWTKPTPSRAKIEDWLERREKRLLRETQREDRNQFSAVASEPEEEIGHEDPAPGTGDDGCMYDGTCDPGTGI